MANTLYYGDNLKIMREYIADESVDLVYLDPPFNSQQTYNMLFKEQTGEPAEAQIKAFTDTWKWDQETYVDFCETCPRDQLVKMVQGFVDTLGHNRVTAYLVMMAPRILELHRVLKPTGSFYLHCDPTASHYLKVMLDVIFGPRSFRNEITWKRTSAHHDASRYGNIADIILFYTKSSRWTWNTQRQDYSSDMLARYRNSDSDGRKWWDGDLTQAGPGPARIFGGRGAIEPPVGRHWMFDQAGIDRLLAENRIHWTKNGTPRLKRYLDEAEGVAVQNIWTDIPPVNSQAKDALGYPTQKPLALLERIITASSNAGDVILDPFCGCGTAVIAAHKLHRQWIGIDITSLATTLIKSRLLDSFTIEEKKDYDVVGEPVSAADARELFLADPFEFQKWAVGLVPRAFPYQDKKGADSGIDGVLRFKDDEEDPKRCVIQVKGGKVSVKDIRDFRGVIDREKATLGLFICLQSPTKPMVEEADSMGFYVTPMGNTRLPRLQIRTVEELLAGTSFKIPSAALFVGAKKAEKVQRDPGQVGLDI